MFVCAYMWARTYCDACELVRQLVEFVLSILYMGFRDQIRLSGLGTGTFMALSHLEVHEYSKIIPNKILKPHAYCNYYSHIDNQRTTFLDLELNKNMIELHCFVPGVFYRENILWGINSTY